MIRPLSSPTLYVVDPGTDIPEVECFNSIALNSPLTCSYHLPALFEEASLDDPYQGRCAGVLVLGSSASALDEAPWQKKLEVWLHKKIEQQVPVLGICYGHQLLAHMFGGRLGSVAQKHTGARVCTLEADPRLERFRRKGPLVVSHREFVVECPSFFETWGHSDLYEHEAIRGKTAPVWGIQPHPEAVPIFVRRGGFTLPDEAAYAFGYDFVRSFLQFVHKRSLTL
jgi:GMP synthase-like glutamine amidotransferase